MSIEIGGVEVLSLDEVSKRLGVEPDALKRCIRRGELVARRIGDQWFVTSQNLLNFLQTPASPSKRTQKHHRAEEPAPVPAPEAAPPPEPPTLPEERIVSAAPGAALKSAEPPPTPLPAPARPPETGITKPETVFAHELPPIPVETAAPPAPPAPPLPTLQATEPLMPSLPSAPVPGVAESEKPTDLNVPTVPLPPHLAAPPRESPAKPPSEPGEALAALFDMPLLPPDAPVMASLNAQAPQEDPAAAAAEARKAAAIEATRRRATLPAPGAIPGDGRARRTLLDSEEMPAVPPEAAAAATATATKTAEPTGARLSDIPNMFGPDSPTVLLTPEQVEADAARTKKLLMEAVEQGRVAQKARDEIVATVRKLPLEEQSFALAGPIGEQLVKLDHMIEEGVRAQKELGLPAAPAVPEVVTAVNKPPAAAEPSKWVPMGEQAPADPVPLIVPPSDPAIPVAAPVRPAGERKPTSRVGPVGGETWQEVGLPVPRHAHPAPPASPGIARLTLSLNDEEKRLLSDRGIAEDTAVQEIMRRFQPTDEKGWSEAKGRYFGPLRGKGSVKA
ncbi:MAG: helix-turn-helix domain-containing protein [Planctomycetia bacterium]|nr:helix-turn-helix domain-containing protein [Planctomycetia bacterium]